MQEPAAELTYFDDDQARAWIDAHTTSGDAYRNLTIGAAAADFFRLEYLLETGGTWIDSDLPAVRLPSPVTDDHPSHLYLFDTGFGDFSMTVMSGGRGHPLLRQARDDILHNVISQSHRRGKVSRGLPLIAPTPCVFGETTSPCPLL
jgi:mannosyltransferase OCH1-like enzyme